MALAKPSSGFPNATGFLAQNWHSCPAFRCRDPSHSPAPFRDVAAQLSVCVGGAGVEMRIPGAVRATGVGPQLQGGASPLGWLCIKTMAAALATIAGR